MLLEVKLQDQYRSHLLSMEVLKIHLLLCQDLELINKQFGFCKPACEQALHLLHFYRCRLCCAMYVGYSTVL